MPNSMDKLADLLERFRETLRFELFTQTEATAYVARFTEEAVELVLEGFREQQEERDPWEDGCAD